MQGTSDPSRVELLDARLMTLPTKVIDGVLQYVYDGGTGRARPVPGDRALRANMSSRNGSLAIPPEIAGDERQGGERSKCLRQAGGGPELTRPVW